MNRIWLLQKGYEGSLKDVIGNIKLTRYQSSRATLTYSEYLKMRENVTELN